MILAIDTSIGSTVAVVGLDGAVHGVAESAGTLGHAEIIGTLLEQALAEAGAAPADITHVAAGMGPGAFTGLRIGIAAARAFALGRGIPVLPVPSHHAAALEHGGDTRFAIVTDARRRENAITVFKGTEASGLPAVVGGPELRPQAAELSTDPLTEGSEIVHAATISAAAVGRVAALMIAGGWQPTGELAETEPLYLRSPDVTVGHTPKKVSA
ncbi:tRNA (adenosine(37)-N6)-threonylcarbamoyltransferase complex dimerization subunit type 1 TsaB [Microbacterium stercoris]|uniref:tRNA (Adenosine(37)-N6)-threonylcarbamoyltransferase complex dimerization subunit type 1 TsaB n=1 Tax=Microbacterium stercoris TaxID=2820289 RepID=A0A939QR67_9MICO|nr:tRNA (adenosine(37)-N6)-threonylcarbamoyltransferase complex dimerization subunit type 1 TsaB [Microbacterium stercoris]MBO3663548.1 tRNA (adenosine(37)-N6)-threonylcarbamoyltransferase complex dimerization subunit type 1 TsaB [Microbacterium stercoris]